MIGRDTPTHWLVYFTEDMSSTANVAILIIMDFPTEKYLNELSPLILDCLWYGGQDCIGFTYQQSAFQFDVWVFQLACCKMLRCEQRGLLADFNSLLCWFLISSISSNRQSLDECSKGILLLQPGRSRFQWGMDILSMMLSTLIKSSSAELCYNSELRFQSWNRL